MKRARPGKAKGAKHGPPLDDEVTGEEARGLKSLIERADGLDPLTDAQLLRALKADRPCEGLYSKACKGKGGNPNCLCHLLPAPEGFRRQGLWAKEADVLGTLGADPAATQRQDRGKPVGLKNLGNTCYVNSVLQCLFANATFRRAVYALKQPVADEPVVKQLRELFLAMEHGCTDPVDPEPLASSLNLDRGVQQDGQEFMKLLLSLLEARLGRQADVGGVIQALFRGQSGYRTLCQECGRPSESSSRSDGFYEVDVPVKGYRSLQDSLNALLLPEMMEGDNQYGCEYCGRKVDASRQLELRALPPLLCFSLQRFVFDFKRMDRVKVSDRFAFPLTLDMAPVVGQAARTDLVYDLEAIMVHRGGSATQGHYVAHIKLEGAPGGGEAAPEQQATPAPAAAPAKGGARKKGGAAAAAAAAPAATGEGGAGAGAGHSWWRFDDDSVTELEGGPTASADHGGSAPKPGGAKGEAGGKPKGGRGGGRGGGGGGRGGGRGRGKGKGKARGGAEGSSDEGEEQGAGSGAEADPELAAALAASAAEAPAASAGQQAEGGAGEIVSGNAYLLVYRRRGAQLPAVPLDATQQAALAAARAEAEARQQQAVEAHAEAKRQLLQRRAERQAEVRAVVEAAARLEPGDPGRFVSAEWLAAWADAGVEAGPPPPVDNAPLLCPHHRLDPAKVSAARRVSTPGWERLRDLYRGGPELGPRDACPACLAASLDLVVAKRDTQGLREHFLAAATALLAGEGEAQGIEPAFYVGHAWLSAWLKQRKGGMGGSPPTRDIACPHGRLAPETGKTRRIAIPEDFWRFLQRSWQAACAERRARELKRAAKPGGAVGGGSSGVWEVPPEEAEQRDAPGQAQQQQQTAAGPEVIDVPDSPPPAGRRRAGRPGAAATAQHSSSSDEVRELPNGGAASSPTREGADVVMVEGGGGPAAGAAAAAAAADADSLLEFPLGCAECPECAGSLRAASNALKGMQGRLAEEKAELAHLLAPAGASLAPGEAYRLVPAAFMARWRAYMGQAGKRSLSPNAKASQVVQPPGLAEAMLGVLCECHRGGAKAEGGGGGGGARWLLAYPPPAVVGKRGRWTVADGAAADGAAEGGTAAAAAAAAAEAGVWEVLPAADWFALAAYYGPGGEGGAKKRRRASSGGVDAAAPLADEAFEALLERGIEARLVVEGGSPAGAAAGARAGAEAAAAAGGERELTVGDENNPYRLNRRATARQGAAGTARFATDPPLCEEAAAARRAALRAQRLSYVDEEVVVELVASEEEAVAAADAGGGAERKSKRARKGRAPVSVSAHDTLRTLRLHVLQALDVHPANARLFLRGAQLPQGDDVTLAECEVYPGDEIRVVDTGEHDGSDLASLFPTYAGKGRKQREAERGFTGTALTGLAPAGGAPAEQGGAGEGGGIDWDAEAAAAAAAEEAEGGEAMAD